METIMKTRKTIETYERLCDILDNNLIIGQSFKLSFWETGNFLTPFYYVKVVNDTNKDEYNFEPERRSIEVLSVLEENNTNDVRPLKGPVPVDRLFPMDLFIKIILMLFFISFMILIWTKRKSSTQIISSGKNQISPHELAKNRLLHLDTNGFSKEFYSELSHITRQFVEKSCYIRALEMTTEEISENENIFNMNDDIFSEWVNLLQKSDNHQYFLVWIPIYHIHYRFHAGVPLQRFPARWETGHRPLWWSMP